MSRVHHSPHRALRRRHSGRTNTRRGASLIEVVIAAALAAAFLAMVTRWVLALVMMAGAGAVAAEPDRAASVSTSLFHDDVVAAVACDPWGATYPVREVTDDRAELWVADAAGDVSVVVWQVSGDRLLRGEADASGPCTAPSPDMVEVAQGVTPVEVGEAFFATPDPCPDGCAPSSVTFSARFASSSAARDVLETVPLTR